MTIKVLTVEDSPTVQDLLVYILRSDPEIRVIGTAADGEKALEAVGREKPDVVTDEFVVMLPLSESPWGLKGGG